jgi:hypothetical protein
MSEDLSDFDNLSARLIRRSRDWRRGGKAKKKERGNNAMEAIAISFLRLISRRVNIIVE